MRTFRSHAGAIAALAFSPDGRWLASASWDRTVRLWEAATGAELHTLGSHTSEVHAIAFSSDGRYLASGSLGAVKLWNVLTGQELRTLAFHTVPAFFSDDDRPLEAVDDVYALAFSPDGRYLAALGFWAYSLKVWELATGREVRSVRSLDIFPDTTGIGPDGVGRAAASGNTTSKPWEENTEQEVRALLTGNNVGGGPQAFSPDGRWLASTDGLAAVSVWATSSGTLTAFLQPGATARALAVGFSHDGRYLATCNEDKTVTVWQADTGRAVRTFRGHTDFIVTVAFSPDGHWLASGSQDRTIKLWEVPFP